METSFDSLLGIVVICIVIMIGGAIIAATGFQVSTTSISQIFSSIGGTPYNLSSPITSVTSVIRFQNTTSNNSTLITTPNNHTLVVSNYANFPATLSVQHSPNLAPYNISVRYNGHLLGLLSNATTDNYTVSYSYLINGNNTVSYG